MLRAHLCGIPSLIAPSDPRSTCYCSTIIELALVVHAIPVRNYRGARTAFISSGMLYMYYTCLGSGLSVHPGACVGDPPCHLDTQEHMAHTSDQDAISLATRCSGNGSRGSAVVPMTFGPHVLGACNAPLRVTCSQEYDLSAYHLSLTTEVR